MKQLFNSTTLFSPRIFIFIVAAFAMTLQIISCMAPKSYVDFREVKNGNQLDKAREIKLDTFLILG